jgi:hypothetical protein
VQELALHILDLLQNAWEAGATVVRLSVAEDLADDHLTIEIEDNGRGMDEETREKVLDPFFTTRSTRHVGLGLPLFAAAAEQCGGWLDLTSTEGKGTKVAAVFQHSHIDRAPLGDMPRSLAAFLLNEPLCDLVYVHRAGNAAFALDTREIRRELGDVPLWHPKVQRWLQDYMAEGERELVCPDTDNEGPGGAAKERGICRR